MKQSIRRFSSVADSSSKSASYNLLRSETQRASDSNRQRNQRSSGVLSGHVPSYVGNEMERLMVSADLLNHEIFAKLLNRSAQEYDYEQKGVLHIPCHITVFESVLHDLRSGLSSVVLDLIDSISADNRFL